MIAYFVPPAEKRMGNLLWRGEYLHPESYLENGMEKLTDNGYWVSEFPEGDGIAFNHGSVTSDQMFFDLKNAFPWLKIKSTPTPNLDEDYERTQIVVMTIGRLLLHEPIFTEEISIYPPGEFLIHPSKIKRIDGKPFQGGGKDFEEIQKEGNLRDLINNATDVTIEVFQNLPVAVFSIQDYDYLTFMNLTHHEDVDMIKDLSTRTDTLINIIKFYNANYSVPEFLPSRVGIYNDRYSAVLIYFLGQKYGHIIAREVELKSFIKGIGMEITNVSNIAINPITMGHTGEVGNVLKHALRLHSAIMEADDPSLKFLQIMGLFEYLAFPFDYKQAKLAKGRIALHLAGGDRKKYHEFCHRYEELGAGLKDVHGKRNGLRTAIIHNGGRMEDILTSGKERDDLFKELYDYTYPVLYDMLVHSPISWKEFEAHRDILKAELGI
jgi:hypothetical protein